MTKLEELKAAYEAATPGEWEGTFNNDKRYSEGEIQSQAGLIAIIAGLNYGAWRDAEDEGNSEFAANTNFIALAHNLMPQLLEAVELLEHVNNLPDTIPAGVANRIDALLEKLK